MAFRVLLADDLYFMRMVQKEVLEAKGFQIVGEASTGTEAVAMYEQLRPDIVVLDITMPEMNGLQLAREIRHSYPSIATIMMSAYHLSPIQLAKADTGVVGFVPKPFSFEELVRFILQKVNPDIEHGAAMSSGKPELNAPIDIPYLTSESQ